MGKKRFDWIIQLNPFTWCWFQSKNQYEGFHTWQHMGAEGPALQSDACLGWKRAIPSAGQERQEEAQTAGKDPPKAPVVWWTKKIEGIGGKKKKIIQIKKIAPGSSLNKRSKVDVFSLSLYLSQEGDLFCLVTAGLLHHCCKVPEFLIKFISSSVLSW